VSTTINKYLFKKQIKEAVITQEELIPLHRINLLLYAKSTKNVSATFRLFDTSRSSYYKHRGSRYLNYGIEGLKDKQKAKPAVTNYP